MNLYEVKLDAQTQRIVDILRVIDEAGLGPEDKLLLHIVVVLVDYSEKTNITLDRQWLESLMRSMGCDVDLQEKE